jgi:hypothetical protein
MITRISPSLISYQNGRKEGIIIVGNDKDSANEYVTMCIDMHAYECSFRQNRVSVSALALLCA